MNVINIQTNIEISNSFDSTQINLLPVDVLKIIFQNLDFKNIISCSHVCRLWKQLTIITFRDKVYYEYAFNPLHWNEFCGSNTVTQDEIQNAYHLLPDKIMKILVSRCPAFPKKRILESHLLIWIPKTIGGKILTIDSFGDLLKQKKEFSENSRGYRVIWHSIFMQEDCKQIKSGWVLMTSDIIPFSQEKNFEEQEIMVKNLHKTSYDIPKAGEMIVCMTAIYLRSKTRLFSDQPFIYSRCKEYIKHAYVGVGDFQQSGFAIKRLCSESKFPVEDRAGVVALRRL